MIALINLKPEINFLFLAFEFSSYESKIYKFFWYDIYIEQNGL